MRGTRPRLLRDLLDLWSFIKQQPGNQFGIIACKKPTKPVWTIEDLQNSKNTWPFITDDTHKCGSWVHVPSTNVRDLQIRKIDIRLTHLGFDNTGKSSSLTHVLSPF